MEAPTAPRLALRLLGGLEVRTTDGREVTPPGRRLRALLACLALPPASAWSREQLIGVLWGDREEEQARGSLREALVKLRRYLGEPTPVRASRETIGLDPVVVGVDAVEFARLARAGELEQASELYRGELLEGVDLPNAGFEDWLLVERTRLHDLAVGTLTQLLASESGKTALASAQRLLQLEPANEAAHRALMRLYVAQGDRTQALRQYQVCRESLQRHLGVKPEPETERLHRAVREGQATQIIPAKSEGHFNRIPPRTQYTKSGDVSIAYQILGDGPIDLVYARGWLSNVEHGWKSPDFTRFMTRLADFSRLIMFDRRGVGLSDRDVAASTLEERVDDIRAVMDAAGSQRAALLGVSEGGTMAVMFAATHPERTTGLVLYGCFAKLAWAPDYPWGRSAKEQEVLIASMETVWGGPAYLDTGAPSVAKDEAARSWWGEYQRYSASLSSAKAIVRLGYLFDVRSVLPSISTPTLVLHRRGDHWVPLAHGRYLAEHIPSAKLIELPGEDHIPIYGDQERLIGEIQAFLTGIRNSPPTERVLLTVLVMDIVGSTKKAAATGDQKWKNLLQSHDVSVRRELRNFDGQEMNTTGDGFVVAFTGPTRAIRCTQAIRQDLDRLGLGIRAALHTGECERRGGDLSGLAVHIASRIADKAPSNSILVSSTVKDLVVGSGIKFKDEGMHSLKGIPGQWPLFSVLD